QAVVLRCLEKDRRARYASIAELAAALAPFARDQRAASMVVDRTTNMQRRPGSELALPVHGAPTQTQHGSAADPTAGRPLRRRSMLVILAPAVGVIGVVTAIAVAVSRPAHTGDGSSSFDTGSSVATRVVLDAQPDAPAVVKTVIDATPREANAAPSLDPSSGSDHDGRATLATCADLDAQKKWQALHDCAIRLEKLGLVDKARELKTRAIQETANETTDAKARQALRDGNLVKAEALLQGMRPDSVYHQPLTEAFERANAASVDAIQRRVQAYVNSRDCRGLRRFLGQQTNAGNTTGTQKAIAVVREALPRCQDRLQAQESQAPTDRGSGDRVVASGSGNAQAPSPQPLPLEPPWLCDTFNVDNAMAQAQDQYNNGFASAALAVMVDALRCKQTLRMYQLAALYACAARDLGNAKKFIVKLPPPQQPPIEQRCQQEGLNIRGP
ncbi:MAG TPA: hypothetical protein VFK02_11725, partial [Kofleriaceae bacterium]|nr:hypothetical protein [Kofleriaceae bacterium]